MKIWHKKEENSESKSLKRKHEELEVDKVESLDEPLSSAHIHGVISSLSPIKKGCKSNYFDGSVSNGKSKVRFVGFSPSQRTRMTHLMEKKQPIQLNDCEARPARRGQKMEILLKGSTKISVSPKKFDFSNIFIEEEVTPLIQIESKSIYDCITIHVKVSKVYDPSEVPNGKIKQDIIVVDASGCVKCVVWEEKIGILKEGECYELKNFVVKEYGTKYLSMAKEGCDIITIEDIGETAPDDEVQQMDNVSTDAEIVGVAHLEQYRACLRCKARDQPANNGFGRCSKQECNMLQKYKKCTNYISTTTNI